MATNIITVVVAKSGQKDHFSFLQLFEENHRVEWVRSLQQDDCSEETIEANSKYIFKNRERSKRDKNILLWWKL